MEVAFHPTRIGVINDFQPLGPEAILLWKPLALSDLLAASRLLLGPSH